MLLLGGINGVLPVWLKRFSVTFYLKPLFPVELPIEGFSGLFTVVAEPTPAWLAVTGLLAFAGLVLAFACWRIRRFEVQLQHRLTRALPPVRLRRGLSPGPRRSARG